MSASITLQQNMNGQPIWCNPNVYPGDANGNPVTPQIGVPIHLWAKVDNNGTDPALDLEVSFFIVMASGGINWPQSAHGSGALSALPPGQIMGVMCSVPWIPDSSLGTHQCIVAVASCLDCPSPPTVPGTAVAVSNQQIGLHNVFLAIVAAASPAVERSFNILNARAPGYVKMTRGSLSAHPDLLTSRGLDPTLAEAPQNEKFGIVARSDGGEKGTTLHFNAGDTHALNAKVEANNADPGTAAIYHVEHYENNELLGGVSLIVHYQ
jgi:hypothetical protein